MEELSDTGVELLALSEITKTTGADIDVASS